MAQRKQEEGNTEKKLFLKFKFERLHTFPDFKVFFTGIL